MCEAFAKVKCMQPVQGRSLSSFPSRFVGVSLGVWLVHQRLAVCMRSGTAVTWRRRGSRAFGELLLVDPKSDHNLVNCPLGSDTIVASLKSIG